jgi:hypothetical protein
MRHQLPSRPHNTYILPVRHVQYVDHPIPRPGDRLYSIFQQRIPSGRATLYLELDSYSCLVYGPEASLGVLWTEELPETEFEELSHCRSDLDFSSALVHEEGA